jgi:hypothetical protein
LGARADVGYAIRVGFVERLADQQGLRQRIELCCGFRPTLAVRSA